MKFGCGEDKFEVKVSRIVMTLGLPATQDHQGRGFNDDVASYLAQNCQKAQKNPDQRKNKRE